MFGRHVANISVIDAYIYITHAWFSLTLSGSRRSLLQRRAPNLLSNAPKGNGIGATGSKNPRALEPLFFSARHGSKNLGLVLIPLCPYTIALRGVAYLHRASDVRIYICKLGGYSELRIDSPKTSCFSTASRYVCILCGAHFYCGSKRNDIASRRTEVFWASAMYP